MRKFVFAFIVICALPNLLFSQWKRVQGIPKPYNDGYYLDVYFLESNPQYGWICGYNGVVLRTTDGGNNWDYAIIPNAYQLESIFFVNEKIGYTSGLVSNMDTYGAIYKSTDGGKSWFNVSPPGYSVDIWGNIFLDANTGFAIGGGCGDEQQFYKTTDGGKSWKVFYGNYYNSGLSDILFDQNGIGYASSSGAIWRTTDLGNTWQIFCITGSNDWQEEITLSGQTFLLPYSGGCTGGNGGGGMRISTDMGKSWRNHELGIPMFGSFLLSPKKGWVVGWQQAIYYTSDAGNTWELKNCGIDKGIDLDDIWCINDTTAFVVGKGVWKLTRLDTAKPEIVASQNPACQGDTVILSATKNYENYKWSTGETSPQIKVTKPGEYWLYAYNTICDTGTSEKLNVIFYPKIPLTLQVSDTSNLCQGDTVKVSIKENFQNYNWSTGETTKEILITQSGKYYITASDSNGCSSKDSINIFIAPLPDPKINVNGSVNFCVGDSTELESAYDYPFYEWYEETSTQPISNDKKIKIGSSGRYKLKVRNIYNCESESDYIDIIVRPDTNKLAFSIKETELNFDSTNFPNMIFKTIIIKNQSWEDQIITDIYILHNKAFSIPQSQFPIFIKAFDSAEVRVCYYPSQMGTERDTLILNDVCWPHYLPMVAVAVPNTYIANTKCNIQIKLTTEDLQPVYEKAMINQPYPNPTQSIITIPITIESKSQLDFTSIPIPIFMYNLYGEKIMSAYIKVENSEIIGTTNYYNIQAIFDLSKLSNGIYIISIDGINKQIFKVMKEN
ncbi:MAG TPA: YCF48-related protein [Candidatus Kapabacteria bacterium]|nr:YCF48-related protein [Candidatus Kapabacteria bacterium]